MSNEIRTNRIKSVLVKKEMPQKDLEKKVKVTPNSITGICNKLSQRTIKLLHEIALVFNVDIKELLISTKG